MSDSIEVENNIDNNIENNINTSQIGDEILDDINNADNKIELGNTLDEKSIESTSILENGSSIIQPSDPNFVRELITGEYEGEYLHGRFHGQGVYIHNGRKYEGSFMDGMFHGQGTLTILKNQVKYQGFWQYGKFVDGELIFPDGLTCPIDVDSLATNNNGNKGIRKEWNYCTPSNPLFYQEIKENKKYPTYPSSHSHNLPVGCYDTIDGYYHPSKHIVYSYETNEPMRTPSPEEIDFILNNYRLGK